MKKTNIKLKDYVATARNLSLLYKWRDSAGLTAYRICKDLHISPSLYHNYEQRKNIPTLPVLAKLVNYFDKIGIENATLEILARDFLKRKV